MTKYFIDDTTADITNYYLTLINKVVNFAMQRQPYTAMVNNLLLHISSVVEWAEGSRAVTVQ